jgi:hypothetical protein
MDAAINHRSNLHIHVGIPKLKSSLNALKRIQEYIHSQLPIVLPMIEPIPIGVTPGEKKREKRRKVSHQTLLTPHRLIRQLKSNSPKEFFELEVPHSRTGVVMWHAQPRLSVNLRQLLQTSSIEFRHFPGTLCLEELRTALLWCKEFLLATFENIPALEMYKSKFVDKAFPKFSRFDMEREIKYQATASHNGLSRDVIKHNIQLILSGAFDGSEEYQIAYKRASGLSR